MSDIFDFIDGMNANSDGTKFEFDKQMEVGNIGETDFVKSYQIFSPKKSENLAWDFDLNSGATVELKTDDYSMAKTPNFFMESVSDTKSGKLGGPFRAYRDGVTFFVYYFIRNKTFFWFDTKKLHARLQELISTGKFKPKQVKNKSWVTEGYAIPRELLASVVMHQDYFP